MEVVDTATLSGLLSTEWLSVFYARLGVLNRLDVQCWGVGGFQRRVSKVVDSAGQTAPRRGSQMSFPPTRKGLCLSSQLVNPRAGVLRYTPVTSYGHYFSEIQVSLICHVDFTPSLDFSTLS